MLALPENWRQTTEGAIALHLLTQASSPAAAIDIARHLITASLDLMVRSCAVRTRKFSRVQVLPDLRWKVQKLVYRYLPFVNDETLDEYCAREHRLVEQVLIVPERYERLLKLALRGTIGAAVPHVCSFDGFISWRTGFASIDLKLTPEQILRYLLRRYNRNVKNAGTDNSLLVEIEVEDKHQEELVPEFRIAVPTYNANFFPNEVATGEKPEFGDPVLPVLIHESEGVRIVLGTGDYTDYDKPDIQIERQPNAWAIFLHPVGGSDPCGYLYFLDDGRSFLMKEHGLGLTPVIQVLESDETIPEVFRKDK